MKWRFYAGLLAFVLACMIPIGALLLGWFWLGGEKTPWLVLALVAGPPEILCIVAIFLFGKRFDRVTPDSRLGRRVSQIRYYAGLAGFLLNGVPLALYSYLPSVMPSGSTKLVTLAIADLIFIVSLLIGGGPFWSKLRALFIWRPDTKIEARS